MSTSEEIDDRLNIFNLISNIKEDLKKLKTLNIPTDESGITDLKVKLIYSWTKFSSLKISKVLSCYAIKGCVCLSICLSHIVLCPACPASSLGQPGQCRQ